MSSHNETETSRHDTAIDHRSAGQDTERARRREPEHDRARSVEDERTRELEQTRDHEHGERHQRHESHDRHEHHEHHESNALLRSGDRSQYRERWDHLQTRFVDDPRGSTEEADRLLDEVFEDVSTRWRDHRTSLKSRWDGSDASTEELRTALRRYRDAFERLLSL